MLRKTLALLATLSLEEPTVVANSSTEILAKVDRIFAAVVAAIEQVFFFDVGGMPLIILWIIAGGIFFTLRLSFINFRGMKHALEVLSGKYDNAEESGEVSHFQGFTTALSGSVGLGNIAGVAIAIQLGGAGTVFWMTVVAILGMSLKFTECVLAQKYRHVNPDGTVAGGPMYYLREGLAAKGLAAWGKGLGTAFAIFIIFACFGGGNMFQANQSFAAISYLIPGLQDYNWLYGIGIAFLVGLVIIGGIQRIAAVTSRLLPLMVIVYILSCVSIICLHLNLIPSVVSQIIQEAFSPQAVGGGVIGVLVQATRRSTFSNGAGLGLSSIAHSATRTDEPIREGIVASIEPFIDTVIICNCTAMVILLSGVYGNLGSLNGIEITAAAFEQVVSWFPIVLAIVVFSFAFGSVIAHSYFGEKAWIYLFGEHNLIVYKLIFLGFLFLGAIVNLESVIDFSDMMLLAMAIPNLIGCFLLSGQVATDLKDYFTRLKLASGT
ncbi:MAG: alanine/glycine:cation symporter family protein, partial [Oscillatoria sp. PMC 1076.18]|nr:alanine/glycine:cation symporter family protein [Oscillatoria sp. PMC 1076.18]